MLTDRSCGWLSPHISYVVVCGCVFGSFGWEHDGRAESPLSPGEVTVSCVVGSQAALTRERHPGAGISVDATWRNTFWYGQLEDRCSTTRRTDSVTRAAIFRSVSRIFVT